MTHSRAGDYECPYCGHDGAVADDFEINVGGSFDCEECGKEIVVLYDEMERVWDVGTPEAYAEQKRKADESWQRGIEWLNKVTAKVEAK